METGTTYNLDWKDAWPPVCMCHMEIAVQEKMQYPLPLVIISLDQSVAYR